MNTTEISEENVDVSNFKWSIDAPRGGKAVMNRILKENATVPLFFSQTLISSLRDVGYTNTTSALCEHVDNAIEAGASEVRVYFRQSGKRGDYSIDAAVYDNGPGMAPNVLKVATSFGGSMNFDNRRGIGRFGMGMKTAALSISPVMEVYSWQEHEAIYNMTLDVHAIGKERTNLIVLPEPFLLNEFPDEITDLFIRPMGYPKDTNEQNMLAYSKDDLKEKLGNSGTLIYMPECDHLTWTKAQTLVDHATKEMARVYRRYIDRGVKIYINNRIIEAFDPTYSMASARHTKIDELITRHSRLITSKQVQIKTHSQRHESAFITLKLYKLPIEEWYFLPRKTLKNDLRVFDGLPVSILRNDREVYAGPLPGILQKHSITNWLRLQIDFPGELDEDFGIATNKQGVRMKEYVTDAIKQAIHDEITTLLNEIRRFQSGQASARKSQQQSTSEIKATAADIYQANSLEMDLSPDEQKQLEENLRGLAVSLRREDEDEEQAYKRVQSSKYIITFRHDDYWPFYDVKHQFGRIILTINTAHPFYTELYEPVAKKKIADDTSLDDGNDVPSSEDTPIYALELLLLSLARTQSMLSAKDEDHKKLLDTFRREWSDTYRIQLTR